MYHQSYHLLDQGFYFEMQDGFSITKQYIYIYIYIYIHEVYTSLMLESSVLWLSCLPSLHYIAVGFSMPTKKGRLICGNGLMLSCCVKVF